MRKIYVLKDRKNSASFILTGKTGNRVRYNFTGGSVIQNIPATFVSENEYCQQLLEESDLFKSGIIRLSQVINNEPAPAAPKKLDEILGVSTASQAINYVADKYNVKVTSGRAAVEFGEKNGFYFPELKTK